MWPRFFFICVREIILFCYNLCPRIDLGFDKCSDSSRESETWNCDRPTDQQTDGHREVLLPTFVAFFFSNKPCFYLWPRFLLNVSQNFLFVTKILKKTGITNKESRKVTLPIIILNLFQGKRRQKKQALESPQKITQASFRPCWIILSLAQQIK